MEQVVAAGTARRLAHLTLMDDPFFLRIRSGMSAQAIDFALDAGQAAAAMVTSRWGREPYEIARALGVPVSCETERARAGKLVLFSEYGDRPPSITLHMATLDEANRMIEEHHLEELLGIGDVAPVHLAHELYHHLDSQKLTPGTSPFRIENLRVGPLRTETTLPSLCEIAADRFAMALLRLRVPPRALQFLTIHAYNQALAVSQLERLRSLPG